MLGTKETSEMVRAKDLHHISKQTYEIHAKVALTKPHVKGGSFTTEVW